MALARMGKVCVVALGEDEQRVLGALQQRALLEVSQVGRDEGPRGSRRAEIQSRLADADQTLLKAGFCLDFIDRFERPAKGILQQFGAGRPAITPTELESISSTSMWFDEVYSRLRHLDARIAEAAARESSILERIAILEPWIALPIPLDALRGGSARPSGSAVAVVLGRASARRFDELKSCLESEVPESHIEPVHETARYVHFLVIVHRDALEAGLACLGRFEFARVSLPELAGTPREALDGLREELARLRDEQAELRRQGREAARERRRLAAVYDAALIERDREAAASRCLNSDRCVFIEGWVREDRRKELEGVVGQVAPSAAVLDVAPREGEIPPADLSNPGLVRPFEAVTEIYGLPAPGATDGTPLLAPWFFLFFGWCLADVGYGILLGVLCFLLLRSVRMAGTGKKVFQLLALCSIPTAVIGALTGSLMGIPIKPLWFSFMDNVPLGLGLAIAAGFLQIMMGLFVKFYDGFRRGAYLDTVFDVGFWIVWLMGIGLYAVSLFSPGLAAVQGTAKVLVAGGMLGLVLTQGRRQRNVFAKIGSGVLSLYGIVGYIGDYISYSRLLALGLASGMIANVIYTMSKLLFSAGIVGAVLGSVVFVGGQVFNLLISVLGSFVHSARLQYIEFFTKFYEGGGRRFSPLRMTTRFLDIVEERKA